MVSKRIYAQTTRILSACVALYVCVSLLYTTSVLLAPILRLVAPCLPSPFADAIDRLHLGRLQNVNSKLGIAGFAWSRSASDAIRQINLRNLRLDDVIHWKSNYSVTPNSSRAERSISLSTDTFLSKAFAVSYTHPSSRSQNESRSLIGSSDPNLKFVPYYYRASRSFDKEDITLTTLVTRNRFEVLGQLVERYKGPISVTIHVPLADSPYYGLKDDGSQVKELLEALDILYSSSPLFPRFVDVHLAYSRSKHDRQFNAWRNAARLFARTDFVMMLDVDFVPCTDFRARIRRSMRAYDSKHRDVGKDLESNSIQDRDEDSKDIIELLREGRVALVIPAFEFVNHTEGLNQKSFPSSKESLKNLYDASLIAMFHRDWIPGHNNTNYPRFFSSHPGEVYKASGYQQAYEPYVIFRREGLPWCDERFVGYGGNKAACLFEMYLAGVSFFIMSDDFLIHQSHSYEEEARKLERRHNRKIYADFREEMCLKWVLSFIAILPYPDDRCTVPITLLTTVTKISRYLKVFHNQGLLHAAIARNAREECKKIKGMTRYTAQMMEEL